MSKVVIIGAGASGMIAAIKASLDNEVILLEKNDKCGKKILVTGNGRCNYWNSDIDVNHYNTDNYDKLKLILDNKNEVLSFLTNDLGIYPKIKDGYYYPYSNQASSILEILVKELERKKIKVILNCDVNKIEQNESGFTIYSNIENIKCDKVIVSGGASSNPKTGSNGSSFNLLEKYHTINSITPSLVPLKLEETFLKDWNGIRVDSKVSLYINNELIKEEIGELQLTDYGVSGIVIFNISGLVSKNLTKKVEIKIDFLKDLEIDFINFMDERNKKLHNHTIEELLESILPYKLIFILLKEAHIDRNISWDKLSSEKKELLSKLVRSLTLEVKDVQSFDKSQVTTGGVSLSEINPKTMESLNIKNLYLTGELLDVDGECGGFNLAFAFITGYIAGRNI